jgi:hypothetical protein
MTPDLDRVPVPEIPSDEVFSLSTASFPMDGGPSPFRARAIVECHTVHEMEKFIVSRDSLPSHLRGFIVPYSQEEYASKGARLFLTLDGRGGVALIDGELGSLFSLPGAHYGDALVAFAVELGAWKLSCYDTRGKLPSLYGRHGFKESLRAPWNDEYAPKTWDYAAWGRPDYVEMSR